MLPEPTTDGEPALATLKSDALGDPRAVAQPANDAVVPIWTA